MTQYKLIYFNGRGRAEVARLLFALADVEYEDCRIPFEEWESHKSSMPFEELPVLDIDGKREICQSKAIARYLAKQFGFAGKSDLEQAKVDMIADCSEDFLLMPEVIHFKLKGEEKVQEAQKKIYLEETLPGILKKFDKLLSESKSGFFVGDEMTWCDLQVFHTLSSPASIFPDAFSYDKYPNLKAFKTKIESNPKIAAWIEKRPDTSF